MCKCKYPKCINKKNINLMENDLETKCYKITIDVSNKGKDILIISNYPKRIGVDSCSRSLRKILIYIYDNIVKKLCIKVKSVIIVNLFEDYDINSLSKGKREHRINGEIIKESIEQSDIIIASWGYSSKIDKNLYSERIEEVLKLIRESILNSKSKKDFFRVGELTTKGFPKNCFYWNSSDELNNFYN